MNMNQTISGHAVHRDDEASKIGMWLFLFTELLLFGGLFLVYTIYRNLNHEAFAHASQELSVAFGTINTVVLITSSLTVALSISAIKDNKPKTAKNLLWLTLIFAAIFMVNKYFEWSAKIHHGLFPGMEHFMQLPPGEALFFFLYFFMTGLHALHIVAGSIFIGVVIGQLNKGKIKHDDYILQENAGLYWHLVDVIWIYLFPLFYLIH
jgi:cytochrome c oxidase subunit 3